MPLQPPTRPHSANPHLHASLLRSVSPTASSSSLSARPPVARQASSSRDAWIDAWDSASDSEDEEHRAPLSAPAATSSSSASGHSPFDPISSLSRVFYSGTSRLRTDSLPRLETAEAPASPDTARSDEAMPTPIPMREVNNGSVTGIAASWATTAFQHVSLDESSPEHGSSVGMRSALSGPSTSPVVSLPQRATAEVRTTAQDDALTLPPGGAWELVEPDDLQKTPVQEEERTGADALRADIDDVLLDPFQLVATMSLASAPSTPNAGTPSFPYLSPATSRDPSDPSPSTSYRHAFALSPDSRTASRKDGLDRRRSVRTERIEKKFARALQANAGEVNMNELKALAWNGVPPEIRPIVWQLLLNYLPIPAQPRLTTLARKRREYEQLVQQHFGRGLASLDQQIWHQIEIDVPRTRPGVKLWSSKITHRALERILYVWAIRHPASGYVQGINDLVCPFFQVFLGAYIDTDPELFDVSFLPAAALSAIEADSFWCLSKLLDGIQDNYISQQPGIHRSVKRMDDLVGRIDPHLAAHFDHQGVEFMQFAFRWMNCLLMREISVKCTVRMWDTYLAEKNAFSEFHLYVCCALLIKYSDRLKEMDFQEMIIFLQCLPTQSWGDEEIKLLLSEAYVLKMVWQGADGHLVSSQMKERGGFGMLGR